MKAKKAIGIVLAILLIAALAAGGVILYRERSARLAAEEHQRELDAVEEVTAVMMAEDLDSLAQYRNLKTVDARGSECYAALLAYAGEHPEQQVLYSVPIGEKTVENTETELTLAPSDFDYDTLLENLVHLPAASKISLPGTTLQPEQIAALRERYPEREISYTVSLLGREYRENTKKLDLTALQSAELDEAITAMRLLPSLSRVVLTDGEGGNTLSLEELLTLQEAFPEVCFAYRFELFGQIVSTEDERIEYIRVPIGNEGEEELRRALPVLKKCSYFLLDGCGIDNEVLAKLREDFPATKIVWRIWLTLSNFLTDIKIVHLTWTLDNRNVQILRFCNEVEYLDLGHNTLSDITFMGYMPNLKYVILSYNYVRDISPLSNCKKLEMLELYFCHLLEDISPLAECESLKLLNISATKVHDISPVFGLKNLERFYCIMNYGIPEEQQEQIYEELPDCWITFEQKISKAVGWSFDAAGGVRAQWYLDMYKILRYRVEDYYFGYYPEEFENGA